MNEATHIAYETILSSHIEARKNAHAKPTATNVSLPSFKLFGKLLRGSVAGLDGVLEGSRLLSGVELFGKRSFFVRVFVCLFVCAVCMWRRV